jgi:enoyl-[acyl-carrier protein] reductase I|tara:strand:- start:3274 stop:4050 length:777 start_codon:yes stop_codon:yes gene_type:complete
MGLLDNKRALVVGVASNRSIAWGIAQAMHREGAQIALTYQNEKLQKRVEKFASELDSKITLPCDVSSDTQIQTVFGDLSKYWDSFDILVHSIAFAPRELLDGEYLKNVTREGFRIAHEISSYSFSALAEASREMMKGRKGAMLTLSYLGAVRSMPNYNVMGLAKASLEANVRYMASSLGPEGIRVNAISAGPIRTLAASGIAGMRDFLTHVESTSPLRRNVTIEEVGNAATFLCSDSASAITGEITYVDCGFNTIGMS